MADVCFLLIEEFLCLDCEAECNTSTIPLIKAMQPTTAKIMSRPWLLLGFPSPVSSEASAPVGGDDVSMRT